MPQSNIVFLEHINLTQPDQRKATAFYVSGLGLTRDPYLMVGPDNMWINVGRSQIHLPSRLPESQRLPGAIGLVIPKFGQLLERLQGVQRWLEDTQYAYRVQDDIIVATCPWGNRFECHAPKPSFGPVAIGMPYLRVYVRPGTAQGIHRFYGSVFGASTTVMAGKLETCRVWTGKHQWIDFAETEEELPPYDGHHIQIYIDDFENARERAEALGISAQRNGDDEWRLTNILDPLSGATLHDLEHEVRSTRHPLFGRVHVNRDPSLKSTSYLPGRGPMTIYTAED